MEGASGAGAGAATGGGIGLLPGFGIAAFLDWLSARLNIEGRVNALDQKYDPNFTAFLAKFLPGMGQANVDPARLASAVAWRESGGHQIDPRTGQITRSGAGALGIMQLMPGTARLIVNKQLPDQAGANPEGAAILSTDPQPWGEKPAQGATKPGAPPFAVSPQRVGYSRHTRTALPQLATNPPDNPPLPEEELEAISTESSQSERRADDAERELIEWKKIKFMQDRVGEDFHAVILSCTKYGFFVELDEIFIEGMVPIASLQDDRYFFRDTDRTIVGGRNGRVFKIGQRIHVLLDRIDRQARRLQFALMPDEYENAAAPRSLRRSKKESGKESGNAATHTSPDRSGKPKGKAKAKDRARNKKNKRKRG